VTRGRGDKDKSIHQRVGNRGQRRGLDRVDAFTAYVMDRLLHRLGRSRHAKEFYLKGGLLVANLVASPHRFTRDIDLLRYHGSAAPGELRQIFRDIVAVPADDGITFRSRDVRAVTAQHDEDGYQGVKVFVRSHVGKREVEVRIDVGFGDAVIPAALPRELVPFLEGDEPARMLTYAVEPVIAEKVETLLSKFPVVLHRLKDVLDVVTLANAHRFRGADLAASLVATFERRGARVELQTLDDMSKVGSALTWRRAWAAMLREKAVQDSMDLGEALELLNLFLRPILLAVLEGQRPQERWDPGGPWRARDRPRG